MAGRDGLLFAQANGAYAHRDNLRRRVWQPASKAARLARQHALACADGECGGCKAVTQVTMRNLRHTAAPWMLASGLDELEVAHRMGHTRPSTTLDVYARFRPRPEGAQDPYSDVFRVGMKWNMDGTSGPEHGETRESVTRP